MISLVIVIGIILFLMLSLHFKWFQVEISFIVSILLLLITNILSIDEVLDGFSNETLIVILLLVSIGEILRKSDILEVIFDFFFQSTNTYKGYLARMVIVIGGCSAFLNNTPIVALMMPYSTIWGKRNKIPTSKLLIPLSYIAILGGSCTLIGSSTNLMINSLISENDSSIPLLNLFDFALIGGIMLFLGGLYLILSSWKLLPSNKESIENVSTKVTEYLVEAKVSEQSEFIGCNIAKAGLRNLNDLYLVKIIRGAEEFASVASTFILQANDIVVFAGDTSKIANLVTNKNLELFSDRHNIFQSSELAEIVISHHSNLVGNTVKEIRFRSQFDAAIIAIRRGNKKISGKIGNIKIEQGDVLLVLTGQDFEIRADDTSDFYVVSQRRKHSTLSRLSSLVILTGTIISIILSALGLIKLLTSLLVLFTLILIFKLVDKKEVYHSIDLKLGVIIAMALALGKAMKNSGLSKEIANFLIDISQYFGDFGLLIMIFMITSILAAYITSKAAIAIMIPVGISLATVTNIEVISFILIIAFASGANFMTPHGYQTNLMILQSGDYTYKDFMRIGLPLTVLYMIVTVFCIMNFY